MAPKRKNRGGAVDSPAESANGRGETDTSADFMKPIYLVVEQEKEERSAYTVIKLDAAADDDGEEPPLRARTVADLQPSEPGMSFVAVHSEHGSWIVGIGGHHQRTGGVLIFDPSTLATFRGPTTLWPRHEPVLVAHGGEVYVLSRRPRVVPYLDFEPWFQSLSFKDGVPSIDCGNFGSWSFLMAPPFFPNVLNPYEFDDPPEVVVTSYAVVGEHILLSPQPESEKAGTYGFHVVKKTWEKVFDENLPFAGQAVSLGGGTGSSSLFAASPMSDPLTAAAKVFQMSLATDQEAGTRLSIQELLAVACEEKIHRPLLCPLGKGRFCSVRLARKHKANRRKRLHVILTTIQTENTAEAAVLVKEHSHHTYKCKKDQYGFTDSAMPVVAALSMDREDVGLFQGNTTKITADEDVGLLEYYVDSPEANS